MKLKVKGIEEIEITDPDGLCTPPLPPQMTRSPQAMPQSQTGMPHPQGMPTFPPGSGQLPGIPSSPSNPFVPNPGIRPRLPAIYTHKPGDQEAGPRTSWGIGSPMIQQAGQQVDPETWEKNWNSGGGEPSADLPPIAELTERSKRILRGEDPDG